MGISPEIIAARNTAGHSIVKKVAERHAVEPQKTRTGTHYKFSREQWREILELMEESGWYNRTQLDNMRAIVQDLAHEDGRRHYITYHPVYKTTRRGKKVVPRSGRSPEQMVGAAYDIEISEKGNIVLRLIKLDALEDNAIRATHENYLPRGCVGSS